MTLGTCDILISVAHYRKLWEHLFPGDQDEHGAVLKAGLVEDGSGVVRLVIREVVLAAEGTDYVDGQVGYRALHPSFIRRQLTSCRDKRLVYLAVHNHGSDDRVGFSDVDLASHEHGYPALLDIAKGMPVGALVLGKRSMQADLWMCDGRRLKLRQCTIVGSSVSRTFPSRPALGSSDISNVDRQVRMFGRTGQEILRASRIAVVGLGGIGSIIAEYLARLGVGNLVFVDPDEIEESNLSRVVGANKEDVQRSAKKVAIATRHAMESNLGIKVEMIVDDVAKDSVARQLRTCDYIFLAADSMRSRLVFNALVHQYLVPGTQVGAKVRLSANGAIEDAMSAVRKVRPGEGCLWCNQLIDPSILALEAKSDEERRTQAYGTSEPNPSVITLNAVAAAHAMNDFLFDFLGVRATEPDGAYRHFHHLPQPSARHVIPRKDQHCQECGAEGRYGAGDSVALPTLTG
jgi:molybdopterin/thiamine biosynthesis adenylyltransferase